MKKKLALLMAAIMTVAMVPMTAFAATKLTVAKDLSVGVGSDYRFNALVELKIDNSEYGTKDPFTFQIKLENGKFAKADGVKYTNGGDENEDAYIMEDYRYLEQAETGNGYGDLAVTGDGKIDILSIDVKSDTLAEVEISTFKPGEVVAVPIAAYALEEGDVKATLSSNKVVQFSLTDVIATAYEGNATVESDGVVTFVEDSRDDKKELKPITITGLFSEAINSDNELTLKLNGNFRFLTTKNSSDKTVLADPDGKEVKINTILSSLNDDVVADWISNGSEVSDDEIVIKFNKDFNPEQVASMYITGIYVEPTSKCDPGDVATLTVKSKDIDAVKLEVAKMVEEAVTYTVEDDDLPVIWAGKEYSVTGDDNNTLEVSVEENTGDILNTSRKATFTFPEGIEVVALDYTEKDFEPEFSYKIDENVVTIWNYSDGSKESEDATDFGVNFLINAAPTFEGDVTVTLGGEFDDVELTVATVKAPYTIQAKTSEVLIDYRYVPVNEIVITEAEEELLEENDRIILEVEKMDFEGCRNI